MHAPLHRFCLFIVFSGIVCGAIAQEQIPDYSRGFESFYALGLPDVQDAAYVRLDKQTARHGDVFRRYGNTGPDIAGTWLLQPLGEDAGEMLVGGINRLVVIPKHQWQEEQEARMQAALAAQSASGSTSMRIYHDDMRDNRRLPGSWEPADVQEDAGRLVAFLEAAKTDGRNQHSRSLQRNSGTLFLLAIHLHRSGATAEANQIAHLLFQKAGGQQAVISAALSALADSQYADLYRDFIANRDWQKLHTGIDALTKRFARGWQRRAAVLKVADMIKPRLTAAPQPLSTEGLSKTDQALATKLATVATLPRQAARGLQRYSQTLWILPNSTPPQNESALSTTGTNVIDQIKDRGMESIPLLIAMLDDTYPTVLDNPDGDINNFTHNTHYYSTSSSSPQAQARMEKQRTAQYYASLPRPMTRGEIAAALLQQVVPASQNLRHIMDEADSRIDTIRTMANEWYEANKAKSGLDLALGYLENDAGEMSFAQNAALMYIAREGSTNQLAIVEQKLLERDPMQGASMAMQYAQMRGDAARPFIEKYLAYLKAPAADTPDDGDDNEAALFVRRSSSMGGGNEEWTKRMVTQFETLLENASLADLLESLVRGDKDIHGVSQFLYRAISTETPTKAVELLLDAAIRTKNVTTAMSLVGMVQTIPHSRQSRMAFGGKPQADPEKADMPASTEHRELWLKLLTDNRTPSEEEAAMWGGASSESYTIAAIAAYAIEALSAASTDATTAYHRQMQSHMLLGTRLIPLLIERATLLVEGKDASDLPPLPDAANVTTKARASLNEKLLALQSPDTLREALDALSMDAYLALMEDLSSNNSLRDHLAPLANMITTVTVEVDDEATKARFEALNGTPFSRTIGEQMLETVRRLSPAGKPAIEAMAQRTPGIKGFTIIIRKATQSTAGSMGYNMRQAHLGIKTPFVFGMLHGEGEYANGRWKLEPATPEAIDPGSETAKPSAAESRKQQLLEMMAASGQDIPPEAIAMLEQMSEAELEDMDMDEDAMFDEDQNTSFWESLDRICGEKSDLSGQVMLLFASTDPNQND